MALPPILVELKANSREFVVGMKEAQHEVQKLGTESSGHMRKFAAVGKAALFGVTAAAVGIGYESVKAASHFEAAMELIRTQAGQSQAEVDRMRGAVLGLAGKTATAPDELAAGLYHLESSGIHGARALEALKIAAEGAKVGGADLESVTNALNAVIASGIPGAKNLDQAMGALNATVGAGDMRMQDLADAMGTGLLAGVKGFGLSLNDVGAALAVFGDNNIRGADAATQLRLAVQFMAKPAKSAGDALAKIGLTTSSLAKDMQHGGLNQALTDLHTHMEKAGYTGAKAGQILLEAFGKKAGVGIAVLNDQFARFKSKVDEVGRGSQNFGDSWKATTQTFHFQVDQLKATVDALAIRIGIALIPIVERAAVVTANAVKWFEKHATIAKILAVAVGSVLVVAISAYIVAMVAAAAATIAATWPILAIIAAVALVGVGIYEFATHWKTIWGGIKSVAADGWHAILTGAHAVANFFTKDIPAAFHAVVQAGRDLVAWIVDKLLGAFGDIVHGAAEAFGWVPGIGGKLKAAARHFDEFRDEVNAAIRGINTNVTLHVDAVLSAKANAALHKVAPGTIGHVMAAKGGLVTGGIPGRDSVPAMLMPGEFVVRADRSNLGQVAGGGSTVVVNINGPVYGADSAVLARTVRDELIRQQARGTKTGLVA